MKPNCLLNPFVLALALLVGVATSATEGNLAAPNAASQGLDHGPTGGFPNYAELDHLLRAEASPMWSKDVR